MKKNLLLLFLLALQVVSKAQPYGSEWINYSQEYYKILVPTDGIYHIPASTLQPYIPGFLSITSSQFAIYHNGQQVPIYVANNNAYIEFYGKHNIGDVDSFLYKVDT